MSLSEIPVLDESYPLYDWADWQSSRDALVKGTPTKYFAKEAWNAIVDSLAEALEAAGQTWDDTYTTAEGAKITVAYGKLTAQKFNSVRHNIERPAPLGWAWAEREGFRGYVGRKDFHGRSTHGRDADRVYPEYILELARKLNLLLEIMRGTAMISDAEAQQLSALNIQADVLSQPSAPAEVAHISGITHSEEILVRRSAPAEAEQASSTDIFAEAQVKQAVPTSASLSIPVALYAEGHARQSLPAEPEGLLMGSTASAEAVALDPDKLAPVSAEGQSATVIDAQAQSKPGLAVDPAGVCMSTIISEVEAVQRPPIHAQAQVLMGSQARVASVDLLRRLPVGCTCRCGTLVSCEIGTAWLPPVWVDGGLWIRQVHNEPIQNENGELEVS